MSGDIIIEEARNEEQRLIDDDLLPNSNGFLAMRAGVATRRTEGHEALVTGYRRMTDDLAERIDRHAFSLDMQRERAIDLVKVALRRKRALLWLREEHEFDELTMRVIAHALWEPDDEF